MKKSAAENIRFRYLIPAFHFPNRNKMKQFLVEQAHADGKSVSLLQYIFCTDKYLVKLNQQFLEHDEFTDILTFPYENNTGLSADIFISVERVKENAELFDVTFLHELHRVIFHGLLHLLGYDDKTRQKAKIMRRKEEEFLENYFTWNMKH